MSQTDMPSTERKEDRPGPSVSTPILAHAPGSGTPAVAVMAGLTLVVGLVSFVLGMIVRNDSGAPAMLHVVATVTGAVSVVIGLYAQMISGTRNERIIIVTGMIAGFVGACLGLAAGGFSG